MPDGDSPAAVLEAPTATEVPAEMPVQDAPAATAEEPKQPAAQEKPVEPDIDALLARDDVLDRLRKHPKVQADIDHRAKSVRQADVERIVEERMRARDAQVQAQAQAVIQRAKEEQSDAETERLIAEDPTSPLALRLQQDINSRKQARQVEAVRQEILQREWPALQQQAEIVANRRVIDLVRDAIADDDTLTDDERRELDPLNEKYKDGKAYLKAVFATMGTREAKKLAKDLAKQEAEAIVQERLAQTRTTERAPVTLPPGEGGMTDNQFLAAYGRGEVTDHAKARRLMGL